MLMFYFIIYKDRCMKSYDSIVISLELEHLADRDSAAVAAAIIVTF